MQLAQLGPDPGAELRALLSSDVPQIKFAYCRGPAVCTFVCMASWPLLAGSRFFWLVPGVAFALLSALNAAHVARYSTSKRVGRLRTFADAFRIPPARRASGVHDRTLHSLVLGQADIMPTHFNLFFLGANVCLAGLAAAVQQSQDAGVLAGCGGLIRERRDAAAFASGECLALYEVVTPVCSLMVAGIFVSLTSFWVPDARAGDTLTRLSRRFNVQPALIERAALVHAGTPTRLRDSPFLAASALVLGGLTAAGVLVFAPDMYTGSPSRLARALFFVGMPVTLAAVVYVGRTMVVVMRALSSRCRISVMLREELDAVLARHAAEQPVAGAPPAPPPPARPDAELWAALSAAYARWWHASLFMLCVFDANNAVVSSGLSAALGTALILTAVGMHKALTLGSAALFEVTSAALVSIVTVFFVMVIFRMFLEGVRASTLQEEHLDALARHRDALFRAHTALDRSATPEGRERFAGLMRMLEHMQGAMRVSYRPPSVFGAIPMNKPAFALLVSYVGSAAVVVASAAKD